MKNLKYLIAIPVAFILNVGLCQNDRLHPQIELRVMTHAWTLLAQSNSFKAELLENDRLQILIPRLTFNGDSISLYHIDRLLSDCGMVVVSIELPNVDDTMPTFECLQDLGPIPVRAVLQLGTIDLYQEVIISNVKYITKKLVVFDLDLFNDTRGNLSAPVRSRGMMEVELCASDIPVIDTSRR